MIPSVDLKEDLFLTNEELSNLTQFVTGQNTDSNTEASASPLLEV